MTGPLQGIRIVELAGLGPTPFAGGLLADLGADVVRVDRQPKPGQEADPSLRFDFYNRNKRSVAFDLKQTGDRATVLALVSKADVLMEGFRPGVTERLGLGPDACMAVNPRLVYGRMTGWGQEGPMAMEAGHDINYLGLTGALHCIGPASEPPPPPLNLVADLGGGGMYLALGVLAAVLSARTTGKGQVLDVAMVDGVAHLMSMFQAFRQQGTWTGQRGENIVDGGAHFYRTYQTRDGHYIAVGAIEPQFYAALLSVVGLDAASVPPQNDRATWPAMRERFATIFRTRTRQEWVDAATGRDACLSAVLSMDEAWEHPHMVQRNTFTRFDGLWHPSPAPRLSATPGSLRSPTPRPGQHQQEVLSDWGIVGEAIVR